MKLEMADIKSEDSVASDEVDDSSTTTRSSYGANLSHAVVSLKFLLTISCSLCRLNLLSAIESMYLKR